MDDRQKTLYHECGHALMATLFGWDIVGMTVDDDSGECIASIPDTTKATLNQVRLYHLGGAAGEIVAYGTIITDCHGLWDDIQKSGFECWQDFEKNAHSVARQMDRELLGHIAQSVTLAA